MKPDVWIPDTTEAQFRPPVEAIANVHDFPTDSAPSEALGHADLLVAGHRLGTALRVLPYLDGLRVIQTFSAGVDAIVDQLPPGITLCNGSGVHDVSVAEWTVLAILASNRDLTRHVIGQREARWEHERRAGTDLDGAEVLIVGHGSIGRAVEERLRPFGVSIRRVARRARDGVDAISALPRLVPTADVVISLLPLTPDTRGVFDRSILDAMKPGALLVNASRGGVVDTTALIEVAGSGRIRAALDVTDPEPLPDGHPLWSTAGVLITPHIAGDVVREEERAWALALAQIRRLARGEPLQNVVVDGY
jgi:phosphoglycerate dehydrogenase-like enzyme